jgi:hypothetical protein
MTLSLFSFATALHCQAPYRPHTGKFSCIISINTSKFLHEPSCSLPFHPYQQNRFEESPCPAKAKYRLTLAPQRTQVSFQSTPSRLPLPPLPSFRLPLASIPLPYQPIAKPPSALPFPSQLQTASQSTPVVLAPSPPSLR